ncbi:iron-hydroxamate ABC transporter substrate-binding protein [Paenibacillus sp. NPDC058071]|uniref:iron-hydroxamate ABC transporter substrate-binding protein n=1 Tax=Paenibacillus sp. NPDC058071 TaxID=3346326 RepID=UPI0036DC29E9
MKKLLIPVLLIFALALTACGGGSANTEGSKETNAPSSNGQTEQAGQTDSGTFIYESENGPVEVPKNPQRVVVLTRFLTGNVMLLNVPLVGVDEMSKTNPKFEEQLKDVEAVSDESLEKIMELEPDLIIGQDGIKNIDKLKQIAPTVIYTYGKLNYFDLEIEIGKLLNKEEEARAWTVDFKQRLEKAGEEIKAKIGENKTITVIETFNKQLYVYGYNFGRGTELLYNELGFKLPPKVEEAVKKDGYFALSTEVLDEYTGDYIVFSKNADEDNSFQNTSTYKNLDAVKNNHVLEADAKSFYFNDPLSLEYQLKFFTEQLLGQ